MDSFVVAATGAGALEAMFGAKGLEPFDSSGSVDAWGPICLLQMFQRQQRQWSRLILSKFDLGELPPPISCVARTPSRHYASTLM